MPILVVEPVAELRNTAADMIKWADRRHRVHLATDGATGWKIALDAKPELVIVSADLPDISAADLSKKLRQRLTASTFVAYSNSDDLHADAFDGVLKKPPQRTAVLSFLNQAKRKRKEVTSFGFRTLPSAHILSRQAEPADTPFRPVKIAVGLTGEQMRFSINVASGCTIGLALRQLGKADVHSFMLVRKNDQIDATLSTTLQEEDLLLVTGNNHVR
jgi:CheY-like chemotaxis protein